MDKCEPKETRSPNAYCFTVWVILAQVFGLASVIIVAVWMGRYNGGFAWQDKPDREFNFHPLFMVIGLVFMYGNAILVYRIFPNQKKLYIKLLHAFVHLSALVFAIVGLKAVFDSRDHTSRSHLRSLHGWIGLATTALFGLQWLLGLLTFLVPGFSAKIRARFLHVHVFLGVAIFALALLSALLGVMEKLVLKRKHLDMFGEGLLLKIFSSALVIFGLLVAYIVTNPQFKRRQANEESLPLIRNRYTHG